MRYTNRNSYPFYVMEWLKKDEYDYEPGVLSATKLIAPIRQTILMERYDEHLECDVADRIAARYGTSIHDSFERMNFEETEHGIKQENRLYAEVAGQRISGKYDLIQMLDDNTWKIVDIKSTSVWTYIYGSRDEDFRLQLSILAFLMFENGMPVNPIAEVVYVFTDWKASDARRSAEYPTDRILVKQIELLDIEEVRDWIVQRVGLIQHYRTVETDKLLNCDEDELWKDKTKYAVMKSDNKRAVRVFEDKEEASQFLKGKETNHRIELRKGYMRRCNYCYARNVCAQYSIMKNRGEVE